jgi:hypothetical protein
MDTKGSGAVLVAGILGILILAAIIFIAIASRECNDNDDCPANNYCGSDFECHEFPTAGKTSYVLETIIIGISLIIATYIFRRGKGRIRRIDA